LRVLETKRFRRVGGTADIEAHVRIVAATNKDLHEMAQRGEFRLDLLYRLNAFVITTCWRRLKIDHPYRLKIDQGELLNSVLYSIEIVDQTELVLPPFLIKL
jgi:hypothetical protein